MVVKFTKIHIWNGYFSTYIWKQKENLKVIIYLWRFSIVFFATIPLSYHIFFISLEILKKLKGARDMT